MHLKGTIGDEEAVVFARGSHGRFEKHPMNAEGSDGNIIFIPRDEHVASLDKCATLNNPPPGCSIQEVPKIRRRIHAIIQRLTKGVL